MTFAVCLGANPRAPALGLAGMQGGVPGRPCLPLASSERILGLQDGGTRGWEADQSSRSKDNSSSFGHLRPWGDTG